MFYNQIKNVKEYIYWTGPRKCLPSSPFNSVYWLKGKQAAGRKVHPLERERSCVRWRVCSRKWSCITWVEGGGLEPNGALFQTCKMPFQVGWFTTLQGTVVLRDTWRKSQSSFMTGPPVGQPTTEKEELMCGGHKRQPWLVSPDDPFIRRGHFAFSWLVLWYHIDSTQFTNFTWASIRVLPRHGITQSLGKYQVDGFRPGPEHTHRQFMILNVSMERSSWEAGTHIFLMRHRPPWQKGAFPSLKAAQVPTSSHYKTSFYKISEPPNYVPKLSPKKWGSCAKARKLWQCATLSRSGNVGPWRVVWRPPGRLCWTWRKQLGWVSPLWQ